MQCTLILRAQHRQISKAEICGDLAGGTRQGALRRDLQALRGHVQLAQARAGLIAPDRQINHRSTVQQIVGLCLIQRQILARNRCREIKAAGQQSRIARQVSLHSAAQLAASEVGQAAYIVNSGLGVTRDGQRRGQTFNPRAALQRIALAIEGQARKAKPVTALLPAKDRAAIDRLPQCLA